MFATLVVEREPFTAADLPIGIMHWTQTVGALAMLGIILWLVLGLPFMRRDDRQRIPRWQVEPVHWLLHLARRGVLMSSSAWFSLMKAGPATPPTAGVLLWRNIFLTAGGGLALLAACLPILRNLLDLRLRRIWALARLSFQEALRKKILYAVSLLLIFFLFANWFMPRQARRSGCVPTWGTYFCS